jgi:tetratricopeptide (TPR) repeat protein
MTAEDYFQQGNNLEKLGKYKEAIEQYKKAVEFDPKHAEAYANWGVVLDKLGKHEEARAKLSQAYALGFTDYSNTKLHDKEFLKFRAITKNTLVSLATRNIFFQTPSKLNDPLDCPIVNIEDDSFIQEGSFKVLKKTLSTIKIFSVGDAYSYTNILMWSHYADNHKGVCIGYKFKPALFENHKMCINKVEYQEKLKNQYWQSVSSSIKHGFFQKYENWQYENEHRVIWLPNDDASTVNLGDGIEISSITFGYKCNQADIDTIKSLVGDTVDYHQIKYSHKSTLARKPLQ